MFFEFNKKFAIILYLLFFSFFFFSRKNMWDKIVILVQFYHDLDIYVYGNAGIEIKNCVD